MGDLTHILGPPGLNAGGQTCVFTQQPLGVIPGIGRHVDEDVGHCQLIIRSQPYTIGLKHGLLRSPKKDRTGLPQGK